MFCRFMFRLRLEKLLLRLVMLKFFVEVEMGVEFMFWIEEELRVNGEGLDEV